MFPEKQLGAPLRKMVGVVLELTVPANAQAIGSSYRELTGIFCRELTLAGLSVDGDNAMLRNDRVSLI
jgi:hypothetical protein